MSLEIISKTVPHYKQRYDTVDDWYWTSTFKRLNMTNSDTGDWRMDACIFIHGFVEAVLCRHRNISETSVSEFDRQFEARREMNYHTGEPGDDEHAPYRREHRFAENIERLLCAELNIEWSHYEKVVDSL